LETEGKAAIVDGPPGKKSSPKGLSGGPTMTDPTAASLSGHAIIAGFGLPGRSLEEELSRLGVGCVVIETNPDVVARCRKAHHIMVCGDARSEAVLREAGIQRAAWLAVVIPAEDVVLDVIRVARRLNPGLRILARTAFTSTGMEATRLGAVDVVVAEQVVAAAVVKVLGRVADELKGSDRR
jgi:CPA2 family monovalent cation:H+ antiporter-2